MYLIPLISTFLSSLFAGSMVARGIGHRGTVVFSIVCLCISFIASVFVYIEVLYGECNVALNVGGIWLELGTFAVDWSLFYDLTTAQMLFTVTGVSLAVHIFATVYMRSDPHFSLFMCYLSLFTFFMLVLVTGDNLLVMMVGWEGIGCCSYLLIGYWSHRLAAVKSAQKAMLVNRISDGLLLWGILWVWFYTGTLSFDLILLADAPANSYFLSLAFLIGAMGKSAQVLFHVWLAPSMEGPTPVSALIHAATLVTAGVYVLIRLAPFTDDYTILVGSITALMAGIFGFFQADLKRVIAFSTCSQLGYMVVSVGLGEFGAEASMSHLSSHASFKAALFLAAGVIIMSSGSTQHMGRYGSLSASHCSLLCLLTLLVCSLSLVGFPETSGFYSKEAIINYAYVSFNPVADYAHTLLVLAAFITSCYTAKLFFQSFVSDFSGADLNMTPLAKKAAVNPLIAIALSLLVLDVLFKVWVGNNLLSGILFFIPWGVKTLPTGLILAGLLTATAAVNTSNFSFVRFSGTRWGFDQFYARSLMNIVLDWGRMTWAVGDKGLLNIRHLKVTK